MKNNNKIICYIFDHNGHLNSLSWLNRLLREGIDTYIIDSGSDEIIKNNGRVLRFDNLYYGGCYQKMCELFCKTDYEWCLQINNDIEIDDENFVKFLNGIDEVISRGDIGVYQPSTTEESHNTIPMNINKNTNAMRYTYRIEGWMGLIHRDVIEGVRHLIPKTWKLGWGMDLLTSFISWIEKKAVAVDDRVIVTHPKGDARYDSTKACDELIDILKDRFDCTFEEMETRTYHLFDRYLEKVKGKKKDEKS